MAELNWTDGQWQKINDAVAEAFGKASVATALLNPCYGPLPGGTETVRNERLLQPTTSRTSLTDDGDRRATTITLEVDHDSLNLRLVNLSVHVELSSEQVAEETLSNALLAFRRAANILAQEEDSIVFDGHERGGTVSPFVANRPRQQKGLADPQERVRFEQISGDGHHVVRAVVTAISKLEDNFNPGPFVCLLGNRLYEAVHTPTPASLVLPADRIIPIVKGPLLRAGKMNEFTGIVVSLGAKAIDLVVGTPPTVQFLQRTPQGRFLFRVYERFVLRLRVSDQPPVEGFTVLSGASAQAAIAGAAGEYAVRARGLADAAKSEVEAARIELEAATAAAQPKQAVVQKPKVNVSAKPEVKRARETLNAAIEELSAAEQKAGKATTDAKTAQAKADALAKAPDEEND